MVHRPASCDEVSEVPSSVFLSRSRSAIMEFMLTCAITMTHSDALRQRRAFDALPPQKKWLQL